MESSPIPTETRKRRCPIFTREINDGISDGKNITPSETNSTLISTMEIKRIFGRFINGNWKNMINSDTKFFLVIFPPLLVLIALCVLSLNSAKSDLEFQNKLKRNMENSREIGQLVTALQRERESTCDYVTSLTSPSTNTDSISKSFENMQNTRITTDTTLELIEHWWVDEMDKPELVNKSIFAKSISDFRRSITKPSGNCDSTFRFYTMVIGKFNGSFGTTPEGSLWSAIQAYHLLLLMKDYLGLERSLGVSYLIRGGFESISDFTNFSKIIGTSDTLLSTIKSLSPSANFIYQQNIKSNPDLLKTVNQIRMEILDSGMKKRFTDQSKSKLWLENMNIYLNLINQLESSISNFILQMVKSSNQACQFKYHLILACVLGLFVFCTSIIIWYILKWRKMIKDNLNSPEKILTVEEAKIGPIFYQLLPKSVANNLKLNKTGQAEHYEEATVFFSDIKGFTTLTSKSTPVQIVEFLNALYSKFDKILDEHDVYKVEMIGDSYMVASGVPNRNGKDHSAEMCSMALHALRDMGQFYIPHMPTEHILMRIGIHTGAVSAGIVGDKMPRYCLFGDTVTTASTMESTGSALRIHLSPWTEDHLRQWHPNVFETVPRGRVDVKFKGTIRTHWLLGKKGFPFRIDLEHTELIIANTIYWKR